ncbi:hypothetical protein ACQPYE_28945 [Actinosynnema sp. CA-299493]
MSTPTETKINFVDENVGIAETAENVQEDGTTTAITPETTPGTTPEQPEHLHDHTHHHRLENGELSPLCSGGGCADGSPVK